jgi:hypothetical protein
MPRFGGEVALRGPGGERQHHEEERADEQTMRMSRQRRNCSHASL